MKAAEIRSDLFKKIEHMNLAQLKEFYGLIQNYFNGNDHVEEWHTLTPRQKEKIEKSMAQADAGNTIPLTDATTRLRQKYRLNG